jgi:hypothetical protein
MAQKITVELQDDLDGGPADETVRFGVDGAEYEIDLSKKNAAALRRKLAPFIEHSRKAGRGQTPPGRADRIQPGPRREHPGVGAAAGRMAAWPARVPEQRFGGCGQLVLR